MLFLRAPPPPPKKGLAVPMHTACKLLQDSCEDWVNSCPLAQALWKAGASWSLWAVQEWSLTAGGLYELRMCWARPAPYHTDQHPSLLVSAGLFPCSGQRFVHPSVPEVSLWNLWKYGHLPHVSWSWPVVQKPLQYEDVQTDGQHRCISLVPLIHKAFKKQVPQKFLLAYFRLLLHYLASISVR